MKYLLEHCPQNPTLEYAESIQIPREYTELESRGGGSTIDVGKWLARKYGLLHTAIPTTAGTGSEVTKYCVLTVDGRKKTFIVEPPDSYVLDPRLVVSLPRLYTISSGLDALSQAFESLWSKKSTLESERYANMTVRLVNESLAESVKYPHNELHRMNMLLAAHFSGRAIQITGTNVCHAISYPLTDWYKIPHGIACSITLKYFAKKFLDMDLTVLFNKLHIPKYSFEITKVAKDALSSVKLQDCPSEVTLRDITQSLSP